MNLILANASFHLQEQVNFPNIVSKDIDLLDLDTVYPHKKPSFLAPVPSVGHMGVVKAPMTLVPTKACVKPAFVEDFYNRIYVAPSNIDLGNVVTETRVDVEIWNAYLKPQLLERIDGLDAEGLVLEGGITPPSYFNALESRIYELVAQVEGPPTINATFEFLFRDISVFLYVTGSRIRLWTYIPNKDYKEELEWLTDVIPSYLTEQRFQMRSKPRHKFYFTHDLTMGDYLRVVEETRFWNDKLFSVPVWQDCSPVFQTLEIGSTYIPVTTASAHYEEGGLCVVWNEEVTFAVEVQEVLPDRVVLKRPLESTVSSPFYIAPSFLCKANNGFTIHRGSNERITVSAEFVAYDTADIPANEYPTYMGYAVITDRTAVVGAITETISKSVTTFDNLITTPKFIIENLRENNRFTVGWAKNTRNDAWKLRQFLHHIKGRLVPFWLIDWNNSIKLTRNVEEGNTIPIQPINIGTFYKNGLYIIIQLKSGENLFRKIISGTVVSSTEELALLDTGFTQPIPMSQVRAIHIMTLCRSDTDVVEIQHSGVGQSKVLLTVKELTNAV